jgi:hypothetical protein
MNHVIAALIAVLDGRLSGRMSENLGYPTRGDLVE